MSRHIKSKQKFVTSTIKLALDNFKNTRLRQDRANEVVSYTVTYGKTFCWQEEKTKWQRKMDSNER